MTLDPLEDKDVKEKVQKILDEMINPAIASHGGFVDLLDVKENLVYLRLGGGCQGCGMVNVTLKQGIEATLKELCDQERCCLVVTTGGTGPARRDVTPEATAAVCDKILDGFGELMRQVSLKFVPTAILSRQIGGSTLTE